LIKSFKGGPSRQQDSNYVTLSPANEQEEIHLIDLFIKEHADKYQLLNARPGQGGLQEDEPQDQFDTDSIYAELAQELILNRVNVRPAEDVEGAGGAGSNPQ